MVRELEKILDVVEQALVYHSKTSEANAALHRSSKVMYTPLASALSISANSLNQMISQLGEEE